MKLLLYSLLLWLPAIGFASPAYAAFGDPTPFYAKNGNPDWLVVKPGTRITPADVLRGHLTDLGLGTYDELRLIRTDADELGFKHHRYQQYHRGVKVEGGQWLIHEKDGLVQTMNGKLVRGLDPVEINAALSAETAIQRALGVVPASRYMWEDAHAEAMLRRVRNDARATFYPQPELVLVDPALEQNPADFQLAWRMIVNAEKPVARSLVFISAADGSVLRELNMLHTQNKPGTAETKYSGTRTIITDSIGVGVYRLTESTRGSGIETYNMQTNTEYGDAVDFTDHDNHWNNVNPQQDEAATDAHWAAEMTYDYYKNKFNFASIDGNDMPLITYVHYDFNYANAFWNGSWATIGDGSGPWSALTSIDIVGHEFSHGLTEFSAGLIYFRESGAINESFSDIFGTAIEFAASPEKGDWLIGEDIDDFGRPLRNMADPKKEDNPDTYKGEHWVSGNSDNGGVHTNSGVQNHWYYLLSQGGTGKNDRNNNFTVSGQGIDVASAIAFRNLLYYLVEFSQYVDAREGTLAAAEDLYGPCSAPVVETARAWYAVGVGAEAFINDVQMIQLNGPQPYNCGLSASETISVQFRYSGCNADLLPGTEIPIAYQIDKNPVVWDKLVLTSVLKAGDTVNFTFSAPTTVFAQAGTYKLAVWTALGGDSDLNNNYLETTIERIVDQDVDMGAEEIRNLFSGCFLSTQNPSMEIAYHGCDPLPAQTPLTVSYRVSGGTPVNQNIQTPFPLERGQSFTHTFSTPANFTAKGAYFVDAWVKYGPDFLKNNDTLNDFVVSNPFPVRKHDIVTFEAGKSSYDSFYVASGREAYADISASAARTGGFGFEITGGDVKAAIESGNFDEPNKDEVWEVNEDFRSQVCVCADLTNQTQAELRFDKRMTYSKFYLKALSKNLPYASSLRVLVNGFPISPTYKPTSYNNDAWVNHKFDLKDYLGGSIEICFQTHTGISPAFDTTGVGDRVLLDNVAIVGTVGAEDLAAVETNWTVMPNPGSGVFTVAYTAPEAENLLVEVVDALGRVVRTQTRPVGAGENLLPLNLTGATPGVYVVRLSSEKRKVSGKIVISN